MPSLQSVSRFPEYRNSLFSCRVGLNVSEKACRPAKLNAKPNTTFDDSNRKNSTILVYRSERTPAVSCSKREQICFNVLRRPPAGQPENPAYGQLSEPVSTHPINIPRLVAEKVSVTYHSITPFFTLPEILSDRRGLYASIPTPLPDRKKKEGVNRSLSSLCPGAKSPCSFIHFL